MRTFNGIDLDTLEYRKLHGVVKVSPPEDLSGVQYELNKKQADREKTGEAKAEEELASAALTA